MRDRPGHYMKADMLISQFATLEDPNDVPVIDIDGSPEILVRRVEEALGLSDTR